MLDKSAYTVGVGYRRLGAFGILSALKWERSRSRKHGTLGLPRRTKGRGATAPFEGAEGKAPPYGRGFFTEHRLRVSTAVPPLQMENEENDSIGTADFLKLAAGNAITR